MPYRLFGYLMAIILLATTGAIAQPSPGGGPTLDFQLQINDDFMEGLDINGQADLEAWSNLSGIISNGGLGDCPACYPNPDIIDFPSGSTIDFPITASPTNNCIFIVSSTEEIVCLSDQNSTIDIVAPGGAASLDSGSGSQPSDEQTYYSLAGSVMSVIDINDLCAVLARIHGSGEHDCANGSLQIGEDLVIEVAEESREDNEFTARVVGRGSLLSGTGPYESHLFNITFALRLDGQPRIVVFNSMPLYTTFNSLSMILSNQIRDDIKYIPRSETETKLEPFHARVKTILRAMIDERVERVRNASND